MKHLLIFLFSFIGVLQFQCSDNEGINPENPLDIPKDTLAFYRIDSPLIYWPNPVKIDANSILKLTGPVVSFDDIISYDSAANTFEFSSASKDKIIKYCFDHQRYVTPYAIVSRGEIISGIYYVHALSSTLPNDFYMTDFKNNFIISQPPTAQVFVFDPDPRKDSRMISVLAKSGKLK